jgi:hypothetical protein
MHYIIYKTTNIVNGNFYIGAHKTKRIDDDYLGSGVLLKKAIKKYGKRNFIDTSEEMYNKEKELTEQFLQDPLCYNLNIGGKGGWDYINSDETRINPMHIPEIVEKNKQSSKRTKQKNPEKYKKIAMDNLQKAVEKNKGSKRSNKTKKLMSEKTKQRWAKNKEYLIDRLSSEFIVVDPEGNEFKTNRLEKFCLTKNLPYTTIWTNTKKETPIKRGKAKGWSCKITQK